jgi:DNA phosphorothioation-dependent restriction protein DptH
MFNAGHKLFFRPADTEMRAYADIAAISTAEKPEIWVKRLAGLKKGECYSLGPSLNEATGKLEAKAFHIKITSLEDRGTHA